MEQTTTMRVRRGTRERVNAIGAQTHDSADGVIAKAVDLYERKLFWDEWERIHSTRSPAEAAEEASEHAAWESASDTDYTGAEQAERADR